MEKEKEGWSALPDAVGLSPLDVPDPHESTKANRIKWRFRVFVWQWGLLFANCPLKRLLRDHSGTNS